MPVTASTRRKLFQSTSKHGLADASLVVLLALSSCQVFSTAASPELLKQRANGLRECINRDAPYKRTNWNESLLNDSPAK